MAYRPRSILPILPPDQQRQAEQPDLSPGTLPPQPAPEPRPMSAEESRRELRQAIRGSNEVLSTATTVFKIFPDTVSLDRAKLTVTKRWFFSTAEVMSIRLEDVLNVTATIGPFFGSLKIVSRVMNAEKPYIVTRFWRSDAMRLKRVIQGYIIALQRRIDCAKLPAKELVGMLEKLGEDDH